MSKNTNREELLKILLRTKPAISTQAYIPILSHFMFDGDSVTSYNDVNAISIPCDVGDFTGCLQADLLIKTLGSITAKEIDLSRHDAYALISAGRTRIKLPLLPVSDFPFPVRKWLEGTPEKSTGNFLMTIEMLSGLKDCLLGVGADLAHPAQMGITLDPRYSDDQGAFYSTDNTTLSRFVFDTDMEIIGDMHVIMPTFFCNQLVSLNNDSAGIAIEIYADALGANFVDGTFLFTKTLPDLEPMDFGAVINRYLSKDADSTMPIPEAFNQAIERAVLMQSSEQVKKARITVVEGKLIMESTSVHGESLDSMGFVGSDVEFIVDPSKVKRVLEAATEMALLPNVMVLADKQNFLHLIAHCVQREDS